MPQQKIKLKQQRKYLGGIEPQVEHAFDSLCTNALLLFVQMILPDPSVQTTIETVVERKHEVKKQQDSDKEPKDKDEPLGLP